MDAGFSDSQRELRDSVRQVLRAECPRSVVREAHDDPDRWRPLWKTVTDLGWTGLAQASEGLGAVELVAVLEECGAALLPAPFLTSVGLAGGTLRALGDAGAGLLQEIAGGTVAAFATTKRLLNGTQIRGELDHVIEGSRAEVLVMLSHPDGGRSRVEAVRLDGAQVRTLDDVDPTRPLSRITVSAEVIAAGQVPTRQAMAMPLAALAADLTGLSFAALELALDYARTREQFGQPIGAFQAVKHRLADAYVMAERARSLTYGAAMAIDDETVDDDHRWQSCALAKAAASEAALQCVRTCVQVHGAIAQTWEHDAHLFTRRAWQAASLLGSSESLYKAVAQRRIAG